MRDMAIDLWYRAFKDQEFKTVWLAVEQYIHMSHFPPTIADIRERVVKITHPEPDNSEEKWLEVLEAVRKYGSYNEGDALRSLDDMTRQAVKAIGYKTICMSENIGVERAHFYKTHKAIVARIHEENIIPKSIIDQVLKIQNKNNLIESKKE